MQQRRKTVWLIAILLGLIWAGTVRAGTISGSAHDFTASSWAGGRMCIACHAPHNTNSTVTSAPGWNHTLSTASYTLYTSSTMNATVTQPGESSKLCLSCHDGTVAVNSFGGATGTTMVTGSSNLGTDLRKSHPIGILYDSALASADGSLYDPTAKTVTIGSGTQTKTGTITSLLLYGNKVECGSCHDVHNTFTVGSSGLSKMDQSGSTACFACHKK